MSQNTPCRFDEVTLAFAGTAVARAAKRPNSPRAAPFTKQTTQKYRRF